MLYYLSALTIGIYIGQEYKDIPSVKNIVSNSFNYLKKYDYDYDNDEDKTRKKYSFW